MLGVLMVTLAKKHGLYQPHKELKTLIRDSISFPSVCIFRVTRLKFARTSAIGDVCIRYDSDGKLLPFLDVSRVVLASATAARLDRPGPFL